MPAAAGRDPVQSMPGNYREERRSTDAKVINRYNVATGPLGCPRPAPYLRGPAIRRRRRGLLARQGDLRMDGEAGFLTFIYRGP